MFKTSSKKVLLSLLVSSLMMPAFASSALESYIDQTINRQDSAVETVIATPKTTQELLAMDHHERHIALTNMLDKIKAGADKNSANDLFLLGYYHYSEAEDNSEDKEFHKAKDYFTQAEKLGSKDAIYLLGELYYYGEGVPQDYLKAAEYYEKAADLQQREALFSLGTLYMSGFGYDENPEKAIEYYQKAAALGDNTSINSLGYFYESGDHEGIAVDLTEAAKWYQQSCDNGDSHGCDSLKRLQIHTLSFEDVLAEIVEKYDGPQSTHRKIPAIAKILEKDDYDQNKLLADYLPEIIDQAQKNDSDALFLLGRLSEMKGDNDYDTYAYGQAKILYEKAIELGATDAIYALAELYYYGNGIAQDYEKSLALYSDPKLASNPEAIFSQAVQYDTGEGVEQNYETSFNLFQKAAALGHLPSIFNIGYMYEHGEFVEADYQTARTWYQQACDQDYSDGCYAVSLINDKIEGNNGPTDAELESLFNEIMGNEPEATPLELTSASILAADHEDAREFLKSQTDLLLERVKNDNDAESLFLTGYLFYLEGLENSSDHTFAQSYALMEKAAEQGSQEAIFYLAVMNYHGYGVDNDYQKSRALLESLQDHAHKEALFYLATIYDEGLGTDVDQEKSFALYRQAADLGHRDSTYNVGFMYHHGEFVTKDLAEAQKWYEQACELGDLDGCHYSARLNDLLNNEEELAAEEVFVEDEASEAAQEEDHSIEKGVENFFEGILRLF